MEIIEKFQIDPSSQAADITESDGDGANWKDIWDYKVPVNVHILLSPKDIFSCSLVGDDAAAMPNATRVQVVRRDVTNSDQKAILTEVNYKTAQEFQARQKLLRLTIDNEQVVNPSEHIVVQIAGVDAATTGDVDASASYFKLITRRKRRSLG